jgi:hypothetical protein
MGGQGEGMSTRRQTPTQQEALELARQCGYLVARDNVTGRRLQSLWWRECERDMRPYVRLSPRISRATVHLDMGPVGRALREDSLETMAAVIAARWLMQSPPMRGYWCAGVWGALTSLPLQSARALAQDLAELATLDAGLSVWELELAAILAANR